MSTILKLSASVALSVALVATTVAGAAADDRAAWLRSLQPQREAGTASATPVLVQVATNSRAPSRATVYTRRAAGSPVAPVTRVTRAPATVAAGTTMAALQSPNAVAPAASVVGARVASTPSRMIGGRVLAQPMTPEENRVRATTLRQAALSPYGATPQMDPKYLPAVVAYMGPEKAGTIVIDTDEKYLYLVQADGTARRYGIGVGRPGFQWAGLHKVSMKREWPGWTPPAAMRLRQPELPAFMEGGPENPLGARAMYLGSSIYRIHGSNAPWTIGTEVSSGCIRMRNEDVTELYDMVKVGTRVIVM